MPTVTIEVVAGVDTATRVRTVSGPDLIRFIAALRKRFNLSESLTDVQVMELWAENVFDQARELTRQVEQNAAAAAIADISLTP